MIDDEIKEYFKNKIVQSGCKPHYCLVPTYYDGLIIHDNIIEKYKVGDISPTHYLLKWIEFSKSFSVTLLYCNGFGAATTEILPKTVIEFSFLDNEFEDIAIHQAKEKSLAENGL